MKRLVHTSHYDWKLARRLGLSDEAVQANLERHRIRQSRAVSSPSLRARRLPAPGLNGLSFRAARIFGRKVQQPLADGRVIDLSCQLFAALRLLFEI